MLSPKYISGWVLVGLLAACGGDEVARTTGTVQGSVEWSGEWPQGGYLLVALFVQAPWNPDAVHGAPAAFKVLQAPGAPSIGFSFDNPPVAFGTYEALVVAWRDPDDDNPATEMHPLSVLGTSLEAMDQAMPVVLDASRPDWTGLELPAMVLYLSNEDMRSHYPSL